MAERARAAALAAAEVVAVLGAFAARLIDLSAAQPIGMDSRFAPDRSGTLLPDGTRWGALTGETISDASGELFASSEVELLVSGLRWSEGPVWHAAERALFFVDTIQDRIYRWSASDGTTIVGSAAGGFDGSNVPEYETLYEPGANGMALMSEDEIIICQHSTRRVIRMKLAELQRLGGRPLSESNFEVLAQTAANGRGLNAPNDVVVAPNGDVYFTDPVYGFIKKQPPELGYAWLNDEKGEPTDQPYLDEAVAAVGAGVTGVYRLRAGGGALELVTDLLNRPNGLAFSPDGQTLWVSNSDKDGPSWNAFLLREQLPLERTAVLGEAELPGINLMPGMLIDGFKIDERGRLWSSVPGGLAVIDPARKAVLASVTFGTAISNVRFGEGGDVFVTGKGHVWRLRRTVPSSAS